MDKQPEKKQKLLVEEFYPEKEYVAPEGFNVIEIRTVAVEGGIVKFYAISTTPKGPPARPQLTPEQLRAQAVQANKVAQELEEAEKAAEMEEPEKAEPKDSSEA